MGVQLKIENSNLKNSRSQIDNFSFFISKQEKLPPLAEAYIFF